MEGSYAEMCRGLSNEFLAPCLLKLMEVRFDGQGYLVRQTQGSVLCRRVGMRLQELEGAAFFRAQSYGAHAS